MIKVLITDDHPIVREGLKRILSKRKDITVSGETSNCRDTLKKIKNEDYDVLLLDIKMPGRMGIDILEELKNEKPELPVLMLSTCPEEQYAISALRSGAAGYLVKDSAPKELIAAIEAVTKGDKYISASLAQRLAANLIGAGSSLPHEELSGREYQVMMMIVSGKTLTQIADELILSVKTVSTFRARVLKKMKMKSNIELTRHAIKHGLTDNA